MHKPDFADALRVRAALTEGYADANGRLHAYMIAAVQRLDWMAANHGRHLSADADWALIRGVDMAFLHHLRDVLAQLASGEHDAVVLSLERRRGQPRKDAGPAAKEAEDRIAAGEQRKHAIEDTAAKHKLSARALRSELSRRRAAREFSALTDDQIAALVEQALGK